MTDTRVPVEVKLSGFRFTDQDTGQQSSEGVFSAKKSTECNNPFIHSSGHSTVYDRMAADKPGQELAEDAAIWNLYLEEASEYDQELVKGRHESLDMLLLFATLFSAILTAFLIESKNLLQKDPADTSVALLLLIAQSQQRVELGLPRPSDSSEIIAIPDFTPTASARWINGIWFASLALSLTAALIAMLGKEWLTAFLGSRPRPAHSHVLLRQSRLEGLERWWALHIIAFLPSLLHVALFLFSIGLVIYLWTLDTAIASVVASLVAATLLFYMGTAVLGAIYEFCPFVTEISGYIRSIYSKLSRQLPTSGLEPNTTRRNLQAILWLANHASDPAIADCAYQALAGLRDNHGKVQVYNSNFRQQPTRLLNDEILVHLDENTTAVSLLDTVSERFDRIMSNRRLFPLNEGAHAVRYAAAVCNMLVALKGPNFRRGRGPETADGLEVGTRLGTRAIKFKISPLKPLALIENLWTDGTPPLSARTYAGFLAVQMELLSMAALDLVTEITNLRAKVTSTELPNQDDSSTDKLEAYRIDIIPNDPYASLDYRLAALRACYSRTLVRVTQILRFHQFGEISLETNSVVRLMDSISTVARCDALNPIDSISTHHPTIERPEHSEYYFTIPISHNDTIAIYPEDLRIGPLGTLIFILRVRPNMPEDSLLETRMSALDAFSALAPIILQQILGLDRTELHDAYDFHRWTHKPKADALGIGYMVVRQMLRIVRDLGTYLETSTRHMVFCNDAMQLIYEYLEESKGSAYNQGPRLAVAHNCTGIIPMLEYADANDFNLSSIPDNVVARILDLAQLPIGPGPTAPCETSLTPMCFPPLIRMMTRAGISLRSARNIFESMLRRFHQDNIQLENQDMTQDSFLAIDYLRVFTHTGKGFSSLVDATTRDDIKHLTVGFFIKICHMASGRDRVLGFESIQIAPVALPGFAAVISATVKYLARSCNQGGELLTFLEDVFVLVTVASEDNESKVHLLTYSVYQELYDTCRSADDSPRARALRKSVYIQGVQLGIGFKEWHGIDDV